MIEKVLEKQYENAIKKGWDKLYIAIDVHDVIVYGNYDKDVLPKEFCPGAKETLKMLSKREDIVLILFTCSWPDEIKKYLEYFEKNDIKFKYVGENPEVENGDLGCYNNKFYFNILLEDKAGFDCERDWQIVENFFERRPVLPKKKQIVNKKETQEIKPFDFTAFDLDMKDFNFLNETDDGM